MFTAAAVRLAELVPEDRIARNCVYPAIGALREISREIALVVARTAVAQGLARDESRGPRHPGRDRAQGLATAVLPPGAGAGR